MVFPVEWQRVHYIKYQLVQLLFGYLLIRVSVTSDPCVGFVASPPQNYDAGCQHNRPFVI